MTQVKDLDESYQLVTNDEEIRAILDKRRTKYKCLFVKVGEGEYLEIFGITSSVPYMELGLEEIKIK